MNEDRKLGAGTLEELARDAAYRAQLAREQGAARNRRPEMYFHAHDPEGDSGVMCWLFPRGMKDKDIRAEVSRQG